jgi:polyphosphate glucokinase
MKTVTEKKTPKVLVVDVGGTNIKVETTGQTTPLKIPSGSGMTAARMVREVKKAAKDWTYDVVSIGYPGPVLHGRPMREPHNLGAGWVGFDFHKAFGRPVQLINDAAMQAIGSYDGGCMLFLGLGTGLGTAIVIDGVVEPMEIAHLPYKKGKTYEDYVGLRGMTRLGKKKWRRQVFLVAHQLKNALGAEYVVFGGGNSKKLDELPKDFRLGDNRNAFVGGVRLWTQAGGKK